MYLIRNNYAANYFVSLKFGMSPSAEVVELLNCNLTEALVLRPLLEDRGRITESIRILVPVDRMKQ